jgi:hypothetical protein
MEQVIKPKSLGGFIQSLSGFFITKENPSGLTPKELFILTTLVFILKQRATVVISKTIKEELANLTNHNFQVTTNYINKLRKKGVVLNNRIHPFLTKSKIVIEYGEAVL